MSTMFHMMGISNGNNDAIKKVRESFVSHPVEMKEFVTPVCFTDEQWNVFKKMLARIAKERKTTKKIQPQTQKVMTKRVIRNHICEDDLIEVDESKYIVKICTESFTVEKFKNISKAVESLKYNEKENVYKCLRGQISSACGYYWVQKN